MIILKIAFLTIAVATCVFAFFYGLKLGAITRKERTEKTKPRSDNNGSLIKGDNMARS